MIFSIQISARGGREEGTTVPTRNIGAGRQEGRKKDNSPGGPFHIPLKDKEKKGHYAPVSSAIRSKAEEEERNKGPVPVGGREGAEAVFSHLKEEEERDSPGGDSISLYREGMKAALSPIFTLRALIGKYSSERRGKVAYFLPDIEVRKGCAVRLCSSPIRRNGPRGSRGSEKVLRFAIYCNRTR